MIAVNLPLNTGDSDLTVRLYDGSTFVASAPLEEVVSSDGRFEADIEDLDPSVAYRVVVLRGASIIYDDWLVSDTASKPARVLSYLTQMVDPVELKFTAEALIEAPNGFSGDRRLVVKYTHAGEPVPGVRVHVDGIETYSRPDGTAVMHVPGDAEYVVRSSPSLVYQVPGDVLVSVDADVDPEPIEIILQLNEVPGYTTPETEYVTHEEVYLVYGRRNVRSWADLDGTEDDASIDRVVDSAIVYATSHVAGVLIGTVDVSAIHLSPIVRRLTARVAGMELYGARGIEDQNSQALASVHQKKIDDTIQLILSRRLGDIGNHKTPAHPAVLRRRSP